MFRMTNYIRLTVVCVLLATAATGCTSRRSAAEADFVQGAGRAPTARTLHALARVLAAKGQDPEAQVVLTRLIEKHSGFLPAYSDLAELHLRHDRPREARAALAAGLAVSPENPSLTNNVGMSHLLAGDIPAALTEFEKAAALDPENRRYQANCALALGLLGDDDASRERYASILTPTEAQHNLAVIVEAREVLEQEFVHARERRAPQGAAD